MKNIIERIAGGAKIARYLSKAVSTRLAVAALAALAAGGAGAVALTPTVVWESDFIDNGTKIGTDGNTYTFKIDNTGNSIDNGVLVISSTATRGATIELGDTEKTKISVLVKYSNLSAPGGTSTTNCFASIRLGNGNNFPLLRNENASSLKAGLSYAGNVAAAKAFHDSGASFPNGSGYALFSYSSGSGTKAYVGSYIASLSGKENTTIKWGSSKITRIALGGPCADNNNPNATAWPNLKIEKVAIFLDTYYSAADVVGFKWPSDVAADLKKWIDDSRTIYAWRGGADFHEGSIGAVSPDGTIAAGTTVDYTKFGANRTAPGHVLYYDAAGYTANTDASFTPFAIGGLCVKSAADSSGTPYTVRGYNSKDTNRQTWLGAAGYETYFEFDESFVFARTNGVSQIAGTVNLSVAAGKEFDLNSQVGAKSAAQLASGAVLKMSGEGNLKVHSIDAIDGTLDFSALSGRSAALPFINGTVMLGANTGIVLPAGTTSPYKLGTAITGTYPNSLTIGTKTYAAVVSAGENAGEIAWSINEADMDSDNTLNGLFTSTTTTGDYAINVTDSSTLTLDSATTVGSITFNVAEGKTLTLSGSTLTATTIRITGDGMVKATASAALAGTVVGDGTIMYSGVLPTTSGTDVVFTSAAWKGVLWLKDYNTSGGTSCSLYPHYWGSAESKIKWTNVSGYLPTQGQLGLTGTTEVASGWILDNGESTFALRQINGYSGYWIVVPSLHGSGTILAGSGQYPKVRFKDVSNFSGTIDTSSSNQGMGVVIGASNADGDRGTITIQSGVEISYPSSMTLKAVNGILVKGTLNIDGDATVKFASQGMLGTLNIAKGKTLTVGSKDGVSHDVGSSVVNVYGTLNFDTWRWTIGPNTTFNLYEDAIVCGTGDSGNSNAALDFNVSGGSTIHALGNATISCTIRNNAANGTAKINVDAGKTLTFSGNLVGSYGLKKQGGGILKLTGSIAKLPTIEAGTVLLGGSKEWNLGTLRDLSGYTLDEGSSIAITQTMAEYGSGVTTVTGVDSSIASITVNKADGTTATLTRTDSTSTLVESVVVSGAACWYDFTFNNTITSSSASSAGAVTLGKDAGPAYGTLTDAANNTYPGLYAYCRPWYDIGFGSKTQFTVALYGTMPNADNTILLDCGGCGTPGALILASGTSANEAKLYYYNSSGLTPLATMAATSCRTTPHLYVFEKISDHQVNIYLDGKLALAYVNNDITFTLTTGFQVASGHAGVPSGLTAIAKTATTDTTLIAMTRIYDRIISDAEMAVLKTEWPYFSPNGDSARTLASGETAADWTETGKWTVNNASADTPLANSVVTLTNSSEADAAVSVNLNANTEYESVKFAGDAAISVALKSGYTGKIVPASTSFETDTTVAYNAMKLTEGAVEVAAGKTLTFDVSSLVDANWANVASIASIQLTGVATLGTESSIAVTPTTSGYWNLAAEADAGGNYYLTFTPNRETGSIYWQSGTYWNSTYQSGDSPAVFTTDAEGQNATKYFAGDTVIIPNTTHRYFGPISDGAIIQFDCSGTIDISKTDSLGYALKNATVTVASGTTLNFDNSWNGASPEVYGGTISGAGKVQVASGITLTLSNGATIAAATALAGAGTVNLASVPTAQMTFDNWTGTVRLPQFAADGAKLTFAGNDASTVALTGITSGWLGETDTTAHRSDVAPALRLDGAVTISGMSTSWQYSFAKITGTGNLSFTSANAPASLAITEIADYTGTLNNSTTTALTVGRISLASAPAADTLLLATNGTGTVTVNAVYVNGSDSGMQVVYKEGGVYSPAATYVAQYGETKYETIQEAIDAAVAAGHTFADVKILDPAATCPDGYCVDTDNSNALTKCQAAIIQNNVGVISTNYFKTAQLAVDAIEANVQAYQKYTHFEVYSGTEAAMSINLSATVWSALHRTVKVKCLNGATVAVTTASDEYTVSAGEAGEDGIVEYSKVDKAATYVWVATSQQDWYRPANWKVGSAEGATASRAPGSTDTVVFSDGASVSGVSGISVAALQVSGTVTFTGDGTLTSASAITLGANDSIVITGTLSPVPTTTVPRHVVKATTVDGTTTYSVVAKGFFFMTY